MADDAYAKRQRRKKAKGQGCLIALLVGGSMVSGALLIIGNAVRWLA